MINNFVSLQRQKRLPSVNITLFRIAHYTLRQPLLLSNYDLLKVNQERAAMYLNVQLQAMVMDISCILRLRTSRNVCHQQRAGSSSCHVSVSDEDLENVL